MTIAESVKVPPLEEVIVDAYMDRHENQEEEEVGRLLVEMHPNLSDGYGCVLASMIVKEQIGQLCQFIYLTHTVIQLLLGKILW